MPELEPITREEKFLNGEVGMTPITREEKILAGEDIETVTRREYFLKKYRGGGGGDVTVVPLSVTENGTYSEEGKAYSPVSVNVPLPQNAYLLKSVANLPQAIASFNDGEDMVMPSLKVAIEPQQEGSGDPSPTNVRPIIGWDEMDLTVADDVENPTVSNVYTIDLGGTRYGGEVDVVSGELVVDRANLLLNGLTYTMLSRVSSVGGSYFRATIPQKAISDTDNTQLYSHGVSNNPYASKITCARTFESSAYIFVGFEDEMGIDTLEKFNQWLVDNPTASICYKIKEPQTYQLTPTAVKSLLGSNNIWADTGDIKDAEYFSKEV